jgi:hypothetical protein
MRTPCPLGCGDPFDGGSTGTSRPLDVHIARGLCRPRRLGSSPLPRELDGTYLSTITRGVSAALESHVAQARLDPSSAPVISTVIYFAVRTWTSLLYICVLWVLSQQRLC